MTATVPDAATQEPKDPVSDAELIDRFVSVRDPAAFAELVHRHSSLVLGVCGRVLSNDCDIEDVFQATFLVLVRDGSRIRRQPSIASWLYGVAYRLALRVARQRQRRRETMIVDELVRESDAFDELAHRHDQQLLDTELNALPERYRHPIVLRYLVGKSPREIAHELNTTIGAVDGLLKRGKDELRTRLIQRGVTLGAALAAVQLSRQAAEAINAIPLIETIVQAGLAWQGGANLTASNVSNRAVELSGKELTAMTTMTKTSLAVWLAVGAMVLGAGAIGVTHNRNAGHAHAGTVASLRTAIASARVAESVVIGQAGEDEAPAEQKAAPKSSTAATASGPTGPGIGSGPLGIVGTTSGAALDDGSNATEKQLSTVSAPGTWDLKPRSPQVVRIERALREPSEVSFTDNPLEEALNYLKDLHHIEIWIDKAALSDEGVNSDQQVTLVMSGLPLRSVLRLMLRPLGLTYAIEDDVMKITTQARADESFETRVYEVRRLKGLSTDELEEIIRTTIAPHTWSHPGPKRVKQTAEGTTGIGGMMSGSMSAGGAAQTSTTAAATEPKSDGDGRIRSTRNSLVVLQTQAVHEDIVDLLNQLQQTVDDDAPITKKSTGLPAY